MNQTSVKLKGQVLRQVYRVWLFRKLLPVVIGEVLVLAVVLYQLGNLIFFQKIIENALNVFFINPSQIISFAISAFVKTPWMIKILGAGALILLAFLLRHVTQGVLRLILVRENYFGKVK